MSVDIGAHLIASVGVRLARFPLVKTLDQFDWGWPKKINRPQIRNLFRLRFIEDHANMIFISNVGLGKSHLRIALGHAHLSPQAMQEAVNVVGSMLAGARMARVAVVSQGLTAAMP